MPKPDNKLPRWVEELGEEYLEVQSRLVRLNNDLRNQEYIDRIGPEQYRLTRTQVSALTTYSDVLRWRLDSASALGKYVAKMYSPPNSTTN